MQSTAIRQRKKCRDSPSDLLFRLLAYFNSSKQQLRAPAAPSRGYSPQLPPSQRGSGQRRPIAFRYCSCSWDVFPYDLLPDRLHPMDLPLGQVSKWHAAGVTIGAPVAYICFSRWKRSSRPWRPFHRKRSPSPVPHGGGWGCTVAGLYAATSPTQRADWITVY